MKRHLSVLCVLVLMAGWVGVAMADEGSSAVTGSDEGAVVALDSVETPDCGAASQDGVEAGIEAGIDDLFGPQPTPTLVPCGTCSQQPCRGAPKGSLCGFEGGSYKYCIPLLGYRCTNESAWDCQCTSSGYY